MYESIYYSLLVHIIVITGLLLFITKKNPIQVIFKTITFIFQKKFILFHLALVLLVLLWNKVELWIENSFIHIKDFSPIFASYEEPILNWIQQTLHHPYMTHFFGFFYVFLFTSIMIVSFFVYAYQKEKKQVHLLLHAIILNYVFAIPFYLFFPINEAWSTLPNVNFLLLEIYPNFESTYREMSGINNCFPSLHTSLSLSIALVALQGTNKRLTYIAFTISFVIMLGILYLGIHWITDMIGGILLAFFVLFIAKKLNKKTK